MSTKLKGFAVPFLVGATTLASTGGAYAAVVKVHFTPTWQKQ